MFFNGWGYLLRAVVVGTLAYAALILFLRISGKRTLGKMNAFDLVVTVAFGSTLASALLSQSVALAQTVIAFALLIVLQFIVEWSSVRWKWVRHVVKAEPTLLFYQGSPLHDAMRRERITIQELLGSVRNSGIADMSQVEAIVLETDGTVSVVKSSGKQEQTGQHNKHAGHRLAQGSTLTDIHNFPPSSNGSE